MFKQFRPLLQVAAELRRIAVALEYFAIVDAKSHNRFFMPNSAKYKNLKDESSISFSDPAKVHALDTKEATIFRELGYAGLAAEEESED